MHSTSKRQPLGCRGSRQKKLTGRGPSPTADNRNFQRYSYIYNELVNGPQDFIGLVAYSIYKQKKIDYVKEFESSRGRPPQPEELKEFHSIARGSLKEYKSLAAIRVNKFLEDVLKEKVEVLDQEYQRQLKWKVRKDWGKGIAQSVLGSFLWTMLLGIVVITLLYSLYGFSWVAQDMVKRTTPSDTQSINKTEIIEDGNNMTKQKDSRETGIVGNQGPR